MTFRYGTGAGLFSIDTEYWSLHFGVYPWHWVWAAGHNQYLINFGLGPVFLICIDPEWWFGRNDEEDYVYA